MRAFIAIDLDPSIKKNLADFIRRLRKLGPTGISWAREGAMHVTLKFLGEIDSIQIEGLRERLGGIAASALTFPLSVRGTGSFPPHRPPRILWVGVEAPPVLSDLQAQCESSAAELGIPREERPFHPHLTLARVRTSGGLQAVMAELERSRAAEFGEMTVKSLILFQSVLKPDGAEYTALGNFALQ
jgi:2'-5' RNA ligase